MPATRARSGNRSRSRCRIQQTATIRGTTWRLQDVPGDGNCFYWAFLHSLAAYPKAYARFDAYLRKVVPDAGFGGIGDGALIGPGHVAALRMALSRIVCNPSKPGDIHPIAAAFYQTLAESGRLTSRGAMLAELSTWGRRVIMRPVVKGVLDPSKAYDAMCAYANGISQNENWASQLEVEVLKDALSKAVGGTRLEVASGDWCKQDLDPKVVYVVSEEGKEHYKALVPSSASEESSPYNLRSRNLPRAAAPAPAPAPPKPAPAPPKPAPAPPRRAPTAAPAPAPPKPPLAPAPRRAPTAVPAPAPAPAPAAEPAPIGPRTRALIAKADQYANQYALPRKNASIAKKKSAGLRTLRNIQEEEEYAFARENNTLLRNAPSLSLSAKRQLAAMHLPTPSAA